MDLGIDIGTSKVAGVIRDADGNVTVASRVHKADTEAPTGRAEQDAEKLLETAWSVVAELPGDLRKQVHAVGVTGQMHGVVLVDDHGRPVGPLITWQDQRCLEEPDFLVRLRARTGHELRTGYGCATLAWLQQHHALPPTAVTATTIADLAVARLCGLSRPVTEPTNAASWGLFDLDKLAWDWTAVQASGICEPLLPNVVSTGSTAGALAPPLAERLGLRQAIPVAVAIGDNQASLVATLAEPDQELSLTLGTGGQLSVVLPAGEALRMARGYPACECRPYPDRRMALVAASLCGGSAWQWLVESAQAWVAQLGLPIPDEKELFRLLNRLGLESGQELGVHPRFLGQRQAPADRGSITGIDLRNFRLGPLARGLARGIITELREMMPAEALAGRTRVVCSGNALRRNELLREMAAQVLGVPVRIVTCAEEAAVGAAMIAGRHRDKAVM